MDTNWNAFFKKILTWKEIYSHSLSLSQQTGEAGEKGVEGKGGETETDIDWWPPVGALTRNGTHNFFAVREVLQPSDPSD